MNIPPFLGSTNFSSQYLEHCLHRYKIANTKFIWIFKNKICTFFHDAFKASSNYLLIAGRWAASLDFWAYHSFLSLEVLWRKNLSSIKINEFHVFLFTKENNTQLYKAITSLTLKAANLQFSLKDRGPKLFQLKLNILL